MRESKIEKPHIRLRCWITRGGHIVYYLLGRDGATLNGSMRALFFNEFSTGWGFVLRRGSV